MGRCGTGYGGDAGALIGALLQALTGGSAGGLSPTGGRPMAGGTTIEMVFNGTSWPTPEQQQAMKLMLTSAVIERLTRGVAR